jgi:hypothetical protein
MRNDEGQGIQWPIRLAEMSDLIAYLGQGRNNRMPQERASDPIALRGGFAASIASFIYRRPVHEPPDVAKPP